MPVCDACGRDAPVAWTFTVTVGENVGTFDSVERAITEVAPRCPCCCCRVLGHGADGPHGLVFCSEHRRERWGAAARPGTAGGTATGGAVATGGAALAWLP